MYERKHQPLLPRHLFYRRVLGHALVACAFVSGSLLVGMLGYRFCERFSWIDALLNASMILGGMGPVGELKTTGGKLFASGYALFSGVVFLIVAGVLFAPIFHRFIHRFHLEMDDEMDEEETGPPSAGEQAPHILTAQESSEPRVQ